MMISFKSYQMPIKRNILTNPSWLCVVSEHEHDLMGSKKRAVNLTLRSGTLSSCLFRGITD